MCFTIHKTYGPTWVKIVLPTIKKSEYRGPCKQNKFQMHHYMHHCIHAFYGYIFKPHVQSSSLAHAFNKFSKVNISSSGWKAVPWRWVTYMNENHLKSLYRYNERNICMVNDDRVNRLVQLIGFVMVFNNSRKISKNVCEIIELYMNFCIKCALCLLWNHLVWVVKIICLVMEFIWNWNRISYHASDGQLVLWF